MAFLDMGDQFLALAEGDDPVADRHRHFGLVVDDVEGVRRALSDAGIAEEPSRGLRFRDPWGNLVEVVQYSEVQFTKAPPVLAGMELSGLGEVGIGAAGAAREGACSLALEQLRRVLERRLDDRPGLLDRLGVPGQVHDQRAAAHA